MQYCLVNNTLIELKSADILYNNRTFSHYKGAISSILYRDNRLLFLNYHIQRICLTCKALRWEVPKDIEQYIYKGVQNLSDLHGLKEQSFKVRYIIFQENEVLSQFLEILPINLLPNPYRVGIYQQDYLVQDALQFIKSTKRIFYQKAFSWAKSEGLDDAIILNEQGKVVETCIANVFWEEEIGICTTPIQDGGVKGVFRDYFIDHDPLYGGTHSIHFSSLINKENVYLGNAVRELFPVIIVVK